MFERFSDQARLAMAMTDREALALEHGQISPAHILLGLRLTPRSAAAEILSGLGLKPDALRAEIARSALLRAGAEPSMRPLETTAKQAIEAAIENARSLKHKCVGTEHMLLGLALVNDRTLAQVLQVFKLTPALLDAAVRQHIRSGGGDGTPLSR